MNLKLDRSSVLESAQLLPDQIEQAWEEFQAIEIPEKFKKVKNVVVAGMGGSALGARIIDSLKFEILDVPLEIVNGYHLPAYANQDSLVIISSYSGNTEETLACLDEALKRKCAVFAIASNGQLAKTVEKRQIPAYIFRPKENPSNQPRMGLGYSVSAQLALLAKCQLLKVNDAQIQEVINYLKKLKPEPAQKLAQKLKKKIPVLVSSEHLEGSAHAFKNMLNENSKNFSVSFVIPEMNHHLLEGLARPSQNKKLLKFVFIESDFYDQPIKIRFKVTKEVVKKNKIPWLSLELTGRTRLIQVFELIYFASLTSIYLALLSGFDPAPIPWVDYFKEQLAAHDKKK